MAIAELRRDRLHLNKTSFTVGAVCPTLPRGEFADLALQLLFHVDFIPDVCIVEPEAMFCVFI